MNNKPNNNKNNHPEPTSNEQIDCTKCKKNPCICPVDTKRTTPPKISWI